jgi:hypothetical protein
MGNIRVGKPDVDPKMPSHTKGVRQGNLKRNYKQDKGYKRDGTSDAHRSTGIMPKKHNPITPGAPNISPG